MNYYLHFIRSNNVRWQPVISLWYLAITIITYPLRDQLNVVVLMNGELHGSDQSITRKCGMSIRNDKLTLKLVELQNVHI